MVGIGGAVVIRLMAVQASGAADVVIAVSGVVARRAR